MLVLNHTTTTTTINGEVYFLKVNIDIEYAPFCDRHFESSGKARTPGHGASRLCVTVHVCLGCTFPLYVRTYAHTVGRYSKITTRVVLALEILCRFVFG
jgi:hypothetical protein